MKFGKGYIKRWQFALVLVAIFLAVAAISWVGYQVWKRKRISHPSPEKKRQDEEFDVYLKGLKGEKDQSAVGGAARAREV